VPRRTDRVIWGEYTFEVVDVDSYRIDQVLATRTGPVVDTGPEERRALHQAPQHAVLLDEVVHQRDADVADDHQQQQPGDRGMQAAEAGHPGNLVTLGR